MVIPEGRLSRRHRSVGVTERYLRRSGRGAPRRRHGARRAPPTGSCPTLFQGNAVRCSAPCRSNRTRVWVRDDSSDTGDISRCLASLMDQHPDLRRHIYVALESAPPTPGMPILAMSVAENPDADGLVLLIQLEIKHNRAFASRITIQRTVTEQVPSETWKGSYHVVSISCIHLRQKLLAMTTDGGATDTAARYLIEIDMIRDTSGVPVSEPRHPDIASGKPWPITASRSETRGTE